MSTSDDGIVEPIKQRPLSALRLVLLLSLIGNILILSNYNGAYWDDYAWLNQDFDVIKDGWEMAHGAAWVYGGGLFILASEFGIFPFRILFLIANILVVLFCYHLLSAFKIFSKYDKVALCALLSFVPYNEIGFFIITMPYIISVALFFGAFFLYTKWQEEITNIKKVTIASIFFASFLTNSLVFFYAIFLIFIAFKNFDKSKNLSDNVINFVKKNYIFILSPALFLIARAVWFMPNGLYQGYNSVSAVNLMTALPNSLPELVDVNIFGLFTNVIDELRSYWYIIIPLSLLIAVKVPKTPSGVNLSNHIIMILVGFTIFVIAAYPYLVAGHMPVLKGFNSRHQLLLPFGFSIMCYFSLSLLFYRASTRIKTIAISIVVLTFFSMKTDAYIRYQLDWFYQQSIVQNFRAAPEIENGSTFLYSTVGAKMIVRPIGFYSINALAKKAFGDDSRMIAFSFNISQQFDFEKFDNLKNYKQYNAHSWQQGAVKKFLISDASHLAIGDTKLQKIKYIFKLRFLEIFDTATFNQEVKRLIALKFV